MRSTTPSPRTFQPDRPVPAAMVASFLDVTAERVRKLAEEGVLPRAAKGQFPLRPCIVAYQRWARDEARKATKSASASRLSDVRAEREAVRLAREQNRLIDTDEAVAVLDEVVGTFKSELAGFPVRVTRDLTLRTTIEAEVDRIFGQVSERLAARGRSLRESGSADAPDPGDDA